MERLPRRAPVQTPFRLAIQDMACIALALVATLWLRGLDVLQPMWAFLGARPHAGLVQWDEPETALLVFQLLFVPAAMGALGLYRSHSRAWKRVIAPLGSLLVVAAILVILKQDVPRAVLLLDHGLLFVGLPLVKHLQKRRAAARLRVEGPIRVVLIQPPESVVDFSGFAGHGRSLAATIQPGTDLVSQLDASLPEEVLLSPDLDQPTKIQALAYAEAHGLMAYTGFPGALGEARVFGSVLTVEEHRPAMGRLGWYTKRTMDIVGGLVGLLLFLPIALVVGIAIKMETPRAKVFYRGTRVGLKGHHFRMLKFTTMRDDAQALEKDLQKENERDGPWFKLEADADPRLTRVGRFVRKYSLNEIPQFWNIFIGEMSLVGPRPPTPDEVATYIEHDTRYFHCLDVKPGLTGLWQITAKNDPSFDRRIALDEQYIQNWSIWQDIKILAKTIPSVLKDTE